MENRKTPGGQLEVSRRKMLMDEVLNNLLTAQKTWHPPKQRMPKV